MQFFLYGQFDPGVAEALRATGHQVHEELPDRARSGPEPSDEREVLAAIAAQQWMLLTNVRDLVEHAMDQRLAGPPIMVLLAHAISPAAQRDAITRLFERYPRLSPGRLYTITPSRVKVRQLPQPRRGE